MSSAMFYRVFVQNSSLYSILSDLNELPQKYPWSKHPAGSYLLKVNNRDTRTTPSHLALVFLFLTLNK